MTGLLFSYIGPDTILPLGSALAAIVGGFLMLGRHGVTLARRWARLIFRRS